MGCPWSLIPTAGLERPGADQRDATLCVRVLRRDVFWVRCVVCELCNLFLRASRTSVVYALGVTSEGDSRPAQPAAEAG